MTTQAKPQSAGGQRRAQVLTKEQRSAIASKAALVKAGYPQATHSGELRIGDLTVESYVLKDGRRLLTQESFLVVMGRAAKAKGGHGVLTGVDSTPAFLAASNLKPLIQKEITQSTTPVEFINLKGVLVRGYVAELLPEVCRVYLAARDAKLQGACWAHRIQFGKPRGLAKWRPCLHRRQRAIECTGGLWPFFRWFGYRP